MSNLLKRQIEFARNVPAFIGYAADRRPGNVMINFPTETDAKRYKAVVYVAEHDFACHYGIHFDCGGSAVGACGHGYMPAKKWGRCVSVRSKAIAAARREILGYLKKGFRQNKGKPVSKIYRQAIMAVSDWCDQEQLPLWG